MAYLNVTEVESGVKGLAKAYKALTELISLPNVTHEGRTSHALRIGAGSAASRDGVLIIGGVHAREWGSCEICLNFAADLLEAYTHGTGLVYGNKSFTAKHIKTLVEGWNLYVFPLVNPDGRHYSQTVDNWWRKNRHPGISACVGGAAPGFSPACTTGGAAAGASLCATGAAVGYPLSCDGVDINRNYDFLWDFPTLFDPASHVDLYTSTDPCHDTYHGSVPFSEPETKNVRWLFDAHPRIKYFVDIHSYSELILHLWGDDQNQTADPAMNFMNPAYNSVRGVDGDIAYKEYIPPSDLALVTKLANHMHTAIQAVRGKNYTVEQSYSLYPTSGTSDDYVYSRHVTDSSKKKVLGFTIEWGTEFQPRWREMEKIILDITAGLIEFGLALPRRRA
jgi:murein tripeptide amidase MpaA